MLFPLSCSYTPCLTSFFKAQIKGYFLRKAFPRGLPQHFCVELAQGYNLARKKLEAAMHSTSALLSHFDTLSKRENVYPTHTSLHIF